MQVVSTKFVNLKLLYDITSIIKEKQFKNITGNIGKILTKTIIHMELSHVKPIEFLFMKNFLSNYSVTRDDTLYDDDMEYMTLSTNINFMKNQLDNILRESEENYGNLFYPSIMDNYNISCDISGNELIKLFGFDFDVIFKDKDGEFINQFSNEDTTIEDNVIKKFLESVYKQLGHYINNPDVVSESYLFDNYYNKLNINNTCVLSDINVSDGILCDFMNMSKSELTSSINSIKQHKKKSDDGKFRFICCTTFTDFMAIQQLGNYIEDFENLRIPLTSYDLYVPKELDNYKARVSQGINGLINIRDCASSDHDMSVKRYMYIMNNNYIKYMISVGYRDLLELKSKLSQLTTEYQDVQNMEFNGLNKLLNELNKYIKIIDNIFG